MSTQSRALRRQIVRSPQLELPAEPRTVIPGAFSTPALRSTVRGPNGSGRIDWLDGARGFLILFVVAYHVCLELMIGGLLPESHTAWKVVRFGSYLRMPAFFVCAGMTSGFIVSRPFGRFMDGKIRSVMYPYLVWATMTFVLREAIGSANGGTTGWGVAHFVAGQIGPYWFLHALLLSLTLTWVGVRTVGTRPWLLITTVIAVVADLPSISAELPLWILNPAQHLAFVAVGVALTAKTTDPPRLGGPLRALVLATAATAYSFCLPHADTGMLGARFMAGLSGATVVLVALSWLYEVAQPQAWSGRVADGLRWVGARSLEIYVAHELFTRPWRRVAESLGTEQLVLSLVLGFALALGLSVALCELTRRLGLTFIYRLPIIAEPICDNSPRPAPTTLNETPTGYSPAPPILSGNSTDASSPKMPSYVQRAVIGTARLTTRPRRVGWTSPTPKEPMARPERNEN